jgi:hypothetical protein
MTTGLSCLHVSQIITMIPQIFKDDYTDIAFGRRICVFALSAKSLFEICAIMSSSHHSDQCAAHRRAADQAKRNVRADPVGDLRKIPGGPRLRNFEQAAGADQKRGGVGAPSRESCPGRDLLLDRQPERGFEALERAVRASRASREWSATPMNS